MNNFSFTNDKYSIKIDSKTGLVTFLSNRENGKNIVDTLGHFGCAAYTPADTEPTYCQKITRPEPALQLQDKKVLCNQTEEKELEIICKNEEYGVEVSYQFKDDALYINMKAENNIFDQVGLALDLDFMDKKQDGPIEDQLLPNYIYSGSEGSSKFVVFRRISGESVLILGTTPLEAWRIVYDYHTLNGFQLVSRFDSNIKSHSKGCDQTIGARISFHATPLDAVSEAEKVLGICIPRLTVSGGAIGTNIPFTVGDNCKKIEVISPAGNVTSVSVNEPMISLKEEGFYKIKCQSKLSKECGEAVVYSYPDIKTLFIRATDAIDKPYHCDFNLCEGAMWLWSLLIRSRMFGIDKSYEWRIAEHFDENLYLREGDEEHNLERIVPFAHDEFSPYHLYKTSRIQNSVTLALIQAEAFKVYNNRWYLDLSARYMTNLVRDHLSETGALLTNHCGDIGIDYTTVTCCVIGFTEVSQLLRAERDSRWQMLHNAAIKMADHLVKRGLNFPTEGSGGRRFTEEGSISCTALTLLHVYMFIESKPEYLATAEQILKFHDAWNIITPDARMYYSSLRWWETHWEGDADGSGINSGHAWTLWKAEANYLYALCTGDFKRAMNSYCGYITNLCKVRADGGMYTCFTPDYITSKPTPNRVGHQFPQNVDHSMPYYLWCRADKTWFETSGIGVVDGKLTALNGYINNNNGEKEFVSSAIELRTLFVSDGIEEITVPGDNNITIVAENTDNISVVCGFVECKSEHSINVLPINRKITFTTKK